MIKDIFTLNDCSLQRLAIKWLWSWTNDANYGNCAPNPQHVYTLLMNENLITTEWTCKSEKSGVLELNSNKAKLGRKLKFKFFQTLINCRHNFRRHACHCSHHKKDFTRFEISFTHLIYLIRENHVVSNGNQICNN